jgi:hypothetical protein
LIFVAAAASPQLSQPPQPPAVDNVLRNGRARRSGSASFNTSVATPRRAADGINVHAAYVAHTTTIRPTTTDCMFNLRARAPRGT